MSNEGKLFRGLKWSQCKDKEGNIKKEVFESEKVNDLNFYLEFLKGKDKNKVNEILKKLSLMGRTSKKKLPEYSRLIEEMKTGFEPENELENKSKGKK